jgi:serine/threonine-protein kinase RsbW
MAPTVMPMLRVPGDLASLSTIGEHLGQVAAAAGLDRKTAYRLRLAVDEIATNAVVHGYRKADQQGELEIESTTDADTLTVVLSDTAPPFDPLSAPTPDVTAPLTDRSVGGLGIYLARSYVDELRYQRVGDRNRTAFIVRLSGGAERT